MWDVGSGCGRHSRFVPSPLVDPSRPPPQRRPEDTGLARRLFAASSNPWRRPVRGFINNTFVAVGLSLAVACSDPVSPESLAGTYVATSFALSGEVTEDVLAAGGTLTITFNAGGSTSGSLFVPAASSASGGMDFTADMAGTFVLENESLTLTQAADSFVRDLTWTVDGDRINGTGTFSGVTITVVLSRQ